jgi:hypothetical protein
MRRCKRMLPAREGDSSGKTTAQTSTSLQCAVLTIPFRRIASETASRLYVVWLASESVPRACRQLS